jgi:hypothetical protein
MTWMSDEPEPNLAAADERRLGELLSAVQAPAPAALQRAIGELADARAPRRRRARRPLIALAGGFAAAAAAVLVIVLAGAAAKPPSVVRVSQIALERATAPAPRSLVAAGTTIPFPHWSGRGWPSRGTRRDSIGGRTVTTEFYSSYPDGKFGYAIVSGAPLRWGAGEHAVLRDGSRYRLISGDGAQIVAWVQEGHTCLLVSRSVPAATLLALAVAEDRAGPV